MKISLFPKINFFNLILSQLTEYFQGVRDFQGLQCPDLTDIVTRIVRLNVLNLEIITVYQLYSRIRRYFHVPGS